MSIPVDIPVGHIPRSNLKSEMIICSQTVALDQFVNDRNVRSAQVLQIKGDGRSKRFSAGPLVPNILVASTGDF